jgi:hypothetical protein
VSGTLLVPDQYVFDVKVVQGIVERDNLMVSTPSRFSASRMILDPFIMRSV